MYFSPSFLQNSLYIVATILIIFMIIIIGYKLKHNAKIWDKSLTLATIVSLSFGNCINNANQLITNNVLWGKSKWFQEILN